MYNRKHDRSVRDGSVRESLTEAMGWTLLFTLLLYTNALLAIDYYVNNNSQNFYRALLHYIIQHKKP